MVIWGWFPVQENRELSIMVGLLLEVLVLLGLVYAVRWATERWGWKG